MAIQPKIFETYKREEKLYLDRFLERRDPCEIYDLTNDYKYKSLFMNGCGEKKHIIARNSYEYNEEFKKINADGFVCGVAPPRLDIFYNKLEYCIKNNEIENLKNFLTTDYVYPELIKLARSYNIIGDTWTDIELKTYNVRPNIEALFLYDNYKFVKLIELIIKTNNPLIYKSFMNGLENTDFNNPELFKWDDTLKNKIIKEFDLLKNYGEKLFVEHGNKLDYNNIATIKGACIVTHINNLLEKVKKRPSDNVLNDEKADEVTQYKAQFENLKFKLDIVRELHNQDITFNTHRGWKHFITNLCSLLLTMGLVNYINYRLTGNFLFFNKTTTQQKVLQAQESVGFVSKEEIVFKP